MRCARKCAVNDKSADSSVVQRSWAFANQISRIEREHYQVADHLAVARLKLSAGIMRIWLPHQSRQLKDPSPEVLHLRGQKQILATRHRQDGIQHLV
jgi:hypothetical protein